MVLQCLHFAITIMVEKTSSSCEHVTPGHRTVSARSFPQQSSAAIFSSPRFFLKSYYIFISALLCSSLGLFRTCNSYKTKRKVTLMVKHTFLQGITTQQNNVTIPQSRKHFEQIFFFWSKQFCVDCFVVYQTSNSNDSLNHAVHLH